MPESESEYFDHVYATLAATGRRGSSVEAQVAFIRRRLLTRPALALLDLCCGQGRHLAALSQDGHTLTGIDSSVCLLALAAGAVNSDTRLIHADVRSYCFAQRFDVIICMESSFNFDDSEAPSVMRMLANSLAKDGVLLLHSFNPPYAKHVLPRRTWTELDRVFICEGRSYDNNKLVIIQERFTLLENGCYDRFTSEIAMSMREKRNLSVLAAEAGLDLTEVYGSFEEGELNDEQPELICLFRHAQLPAQ